MTFNTSELGDNYPGGKTDKEIEDLVAKMYAELASKSYGTNFVNQLMPLIQYGQNELQARKSKTATTIAISISVVSGIVGAVALVMSLVSSHSSSEWKTDQMTKLGEIETTISTAVNQQTIIQSLSTIATNQTDQKLAIQSVRDRLDRELCTKGLVDDVALQECK